MSIRKLSIIMMLFFIAGMVACGNQTSETAFLPVTWSDLSVGDDDEEGEENGEDEGDEDSDDEDGDGNLCGEMPSCHEANKFGTPCSVVTGGECVDGCCTEGPCGSGVLCSFFEEVGTSCHGTCDDNGCCVVGKKDLVDGEIPPVDIPDHDNGPPDDEDPDDGPPEDLPGNVPDNIPPERP